MAYVRKTKDEYWLVANYGIGWEELFCEDSYKEARRQYLTYCREEGYHASFKIVKHRVKI